MSATRSTALSARADEKSEMIQAYRVVVPPGS